MRILFWTITGFCLLTIATSKPAAAQSSASSILTVSHITEISSALPAKPNGPGKPITDRSYWQPLSSNPTFSGLIKKAESIIKSPLPEQPDKLFLEFSRNGNRRNFENVAFSRRNRLAPLVLAECVMNTGKFLPAINEHINAYCQERTWVLPAHDKQLTNFNGTTVTIDLFSSNLAWQIATADYLLGDKLPAPTRQLLRREISRRIIIPFQQMIRGQRKADSWLTANHNWNPVCLSGVTGAALLLVPNRQEQAEFVGAAEYYSLNFLAGFTPDGYCSEGVGYWNYGFGMYTMMSENLARATGGKVQLLQNPHAAKPAAYGTQITIADNIVPSFADCSLAARPSAALLWLLNHRLNWNNAAYANLNQNQTIASLFEALIYHDALLSQSAPITAAAAPSLGIRSYFPDAQVYIGRPAAPSSKSLAVAFKGGNNNEHHNHNDLGSYVVLVGGKPVLVDPGAEVYTARTFSKQRYDSKLLNSFGHPVPVIDGKLQRTGKNAQAKVLKHEFTDTTDTITLELESAYKDKNLKSLTRTFEYGRTNNTLIITDRAEFNKPTAFETALISLGDFQSQNNGPVVVTATNTSAAIQISASHPYSLKQEKIEENAAAKPNRLGIVLKDPAKVATITTVIRPQ